MIMKKAEAQKAIAALQKFIEGKDITFEERMSINELHGEVEFAFAYIDEHYEEG